MHSTIGDFLLRRLAELDIDHVFGVPGDYNLQFLDQLQQTPALSFVGCCNELNAAYAADGYARLRGVSALLTTYGVGDLSALCGIAGAAAEHVAMVCITGAPPLHAMRRRLPLHHTLADGNYDDVMICLQQFTAAQARLTPENAVTEIDRVLRACVLTQQPVYLQLPSDISHVTVETPSTPLLTHASVDQARLEAAVQHALRLWNRAQQPAILVDMDAQRHGYADALLTLAVATGTPYAALSTGKAILPETHPLSRGLYVGQHSAPATRSLIETSDCLIAVAPRWIEGNSGLFTASLPSAGCIQLEAQSVTIDGTSYYAVPPAALLHGMHQALSASPAAVPAGQAPRLAQPAPATDAMLSQARLWPRMARFIRAGDVVIAEAGTANIGLMPQTLPTGVHYINASIWGAIGHTLPAVLGSSLAAPARRHLLFIGDGSFQLTAQELSTLLRAGQTPIVFLLNNRGYTIERYILGMHDAYNDVADWDYQALPAVFASADRYATLSARTETELEAALTQAEALRGKLVFIELHLDPCDAPEGLKRFGPATAEFDYGPLGPQRPQPQAALV